MKPRSIYDFSVTSLEGEKISLDRYKNKVMLIVNVASHCGFTPQYSILQSLYEKYKDEGFIILAFPCNQFLHQEPGTPEEIKQFCKLHYHISFPLFEKIKVNGKDTHPLFKYLKAQKKGWFWTEAIKWNFTKFLIDRKGKVIKRYATAQIKRIEQDLEKILRAPH